ncbi:PG0541 family transporter-associated protein [Saccharicrinis sp. FJH62]|uniref:PG0541 family transporter-associated protein n=1 Tax=Saccharicrinis sp. FJH62 TaxID=3344657 RepID=UPI0035D45DCA
MDKPALKAVFITYNQALTEKVEYVLDRMGIRGYTQWENVMGRGSVDGNPHMGTHTWPEINSSILAIIDDSKVSDLLDNVVRLDNVNKDVGIRAFVWDVTQTV